MCTLLRGANTFRILVHRTSAAGLCAQLHGLRIQITRYGIVSTLGYDSNTTGTHHTHIAHDRNSCAAGPISASSICIDGCRRPCIADLVNCRSPDSSTPRCDPRSVFAVLESFPLCGANVHDAEHFGDQTYNLDYSWVMAVRVAEPKR